MNIDLSQKKGLAPSRYGDALLSTLTNDLKPVDHLSTLVMPKAQVDFLLSTGNAMIDK